MLQEGQILKERYRIQAVLGKGAYGTVYLSEDLTIPQVVWAVKEIDETSLGRDEAAEAIQRFEREAQTLGRLNHPGIPKVVELFSQGHCHYLVMEYIEGKNFEEYCREFDRFLGPEEILPWMIRLCDILEYLHTQSPPVIFRDIKPANIIITSGGRLKLVDFGISRAFDPLKASDTQQLGTPGFCAPEQYGTGQSDARSDVYSAGATMYQILSEQDTSKFNFTFPPLRHFNTKVSGGLEKVVLKCLNRDAGQRYHSARELGEALSYIRQAMAAGTRRKTVVGEVLGVLDELMKHGVVFLVLFIIVLLFLGLLSDLFYGDIFDGPRCEIFRWLPFFATFILPCAYLIYRIIRAAK